MALKALLYAYILGALTFIPLLVAAAVFFAIYTSVPVGDPDPTKGAKRVLEAASGEERANEVEAQPQASIETSDLPRTRKGWLTMRRTFEETSLDGGYVTLVRSFLDARSKDPKRSRPKDMWYVVLKANVLYLYENEDMSDCEAAVELGGHDVIIFPEGLLDGELFAKRNAICLKPRPPKDGEETVDVKKHAKDGDKARDEETLDSATPWFIFVRSNVEMEDWYFALIHASEHPTQTPTLSTLHAIFQPSDMNHLVTTLDEQPDVIPMRWLNALMGRIFFSYYRTNNLEAYIIGRLMKKLAKVKRPAFLTDIVVKEVSVGNKTPTLSKPMLKELTKEGDASMEVHLQYKGEIRITIEATATINLGARFKSYTVKLVLAAVLKELEGNLLIKVKRPPSNRIWYAFTQSPKMVLEVEPIVSDRQITWGMILSTIESRLKEIIQESVVMPNMDDIAFFESLPYEHRGGIWPDAARRERAPSIPEQVPDNGGPVIAVPGTDNETIPLVDAEPEPQPTVELTADAPQPQTLDATNISPPPNTPPADETSNSLRTNRKSWFSSIRSEDLQSLATQETRDDKPPEVDAQRGRTSEVEKLPSPRSQSTPGKTESLPSETSDQDSREELRPPVYLTPQTARRASSHHSSSRDFSKSISDDSSSDEAPPKVADSPYPTFSNPPSSPTSFLSTLKSRAGDKQALSNTAKEAMRKWGVNWGGLRKDSSSTNSEDISDNGSTSSRFLSDSISLMQKTRTSYAEVRAAVAERKGRDNSAQGEEGLGVNRTPSPSSLSEAAKGKARAVSNPTMMASEPSLFSAFPSRSGTSSPTPSSGHLSVAEPVAGSRKSSPSMSRSSTEPDEKGPPEDGPKPAPIHVQPQAKTMTIPGIHVSHRGDVMSMGSVAPQPPSVTPSDSKLKNPGIQSVYRLWRSPVLSEQHPEQPGSSPTLMQGEAGENDKDITPLALPPSIQTAAPRPAPPPLPPRSTPAAISRPPLLSPKLSSDTLQTSASEVLKSIASKDGFTRIAEPRAPTVVPAESLSTEEKERDVQTSDLDLDDSLASAPPVLTPVSNPGPPLPPRRIQTVA